MSDETTPPAVPPSTPDSVSMKLAKVLADPELNRILVPLLAATDSDGDGKPDLMGVKNLWSKDGDFSSTKLLATLAGITVLVVSTFCVLFAGAQVNLAITTFTVPVFNSEWALLITGLFQANNHVDTRLKHIAAKEETATTA